MQRDREAIMQYLRVHTETACLTHSEASKAENTPDMHTTRHQTGQHWYEYLPTGVYQYYLIFDTETTTDEKQELRFGIYELHGGQRIKLLSALSNAQEIPLDACDTLLLHGIFYNPAILSDTEIALLESYANTHDMHCHTVDKFVHMFYAFAHNKSCYTLVIGHNLPFDLSRLMQEVQFPQTDFENGFSLKLCTCTWERTGRKRSTGDSCRKHPSIKIKKISPKASIFEFADKQPRGNFLDTATLARALLGPGSTSLDALGKILGIEEKKLEDAIHGVTLTDDYLDYACRDVRATWQIYCKLRAIYASYNFNQKIHYIFSEASLGKALYKELGITPAMARMQNISSEIHGYAMSSYYGGRSEVHVRKQECEIAYCDFKSQYPTVFSLMGLQELLLAERYEVEDVTAYIRNSLPDFQLAWLRASNYWTVLRVLCKISGSNIILPVRAQFNEQTNNIALCNVEMTQGTWYTLADILANILLGGAIPTIEQAIEIVPHGRITMRKLAMFDGLVTIDPSNHDIFTTLINERSRIKAQAAMSTGPEQEKLDRTQLAIKLLANSTSYGVNVELRTEDTEQELLLYGNDGALNAASSLAQQPGLFYCPVIGTHIPACGRLLLAIAQCLGAARGLSYAFCDTDSMAFVKPTEMAIDAFYGYVQEIQEWFKPLYPYNDTGELFELEDVNRWGNTLEPLYFLGISAKRYALYNEVGYERRHINQFTSYYLPVYRLRKVSSHGLGAYRVSDNYTSPGWIPEPATPLNKLGLTTHTQWIYDLWYEYIVLQNMFGASAAMVAPLWERPALDTSAYQQTTLNTAYLFKLFSHIPGMKPYNFVTTFFAFPAHILQQRIQTYPALKEAYQHITSSLYVPFTTNVNDVNVYYVVKSNMMVANIKPLTVREALATYFEHPEYKSANGHFSGEMHMRDVRITGYIPQGKESSYEVYALEESGLPASLAREAINLEYMTRDQWEALKEAIYTYGVNALARKLDTYPMQISRWLSSARPPNGATIKRIKQALAL